MEFKAAIFVLSHLWPLMFPFFQKLIWFGNAHEVLCKSHKYFTLAPFFNIYDDLIFSLFAKYIGLSSFTLIHFEMYTCIYTQSKCLWSVIFIKSHIYLAAVSVLSHLWSLMYSLFGKHICFVLIYANKFWIGHIYVSTNMCFCSNDNARIKWQSPAVDIW